MSLYPFSVQRLGSRKGGGLRHYLCFKIEAHETNWDRKGCEVTDAVLMMVIIGSAWLERGV